MKPSELRHSPATPQTNPKAAKLLKSSPENIQKAAELLEKGELVVIPTETVYGLAASIHQPKAIERIFELKQRPPNNPLIVHFHSLEQLPELTHQAPEKLLTLAKAYWPGPLTLIVPKHPKVHSSITGGQNTIALRMPKHPVALKLLRQKNLALAAPSANPSGYLSPTQPEHVLRHLTGFACVLDAGSCEHGLESTIVDLTETIPTLLREGPISKASLEATLKTPIRRPEKPDPLKPKAPGQLPRHYSPKTPLQVHPLKQMPHELKLGEAFVSFAGKSEPENHRYSLSATADPREAARKLFELLHELDANPQYQRIHISRMPPHGIGAAINERIERAASQHH